MYLRSIILSLLMISSLSATSQQNLLGGAAFVAGGLICAIPAVKWNYTWIQLTLQEQEHKKQLKELGATLHEIKEIVGHQVVTGEYILMHPYPCSEEKKEVIDKHFDTLVNAHKQVGRYIVGGALSTVFTVLGVWIGSQIMLDAISHKEI